MGVRADTLLGRTSRRARGLRPLSLDGSPPLLSSLRPPLCSSPKLNPGRRLGPALRREGGSRGGAGLPNGRSRAGGGALFQLRPRARGASRAQNVARPRPPLRALRRAEQALGTLEQAGRLHVHSAHPPAPVRVAEGAGAPRGERGRVQRKLGRPGRGTRRPGKSLPEAPSAARGRRALLSPTPAAALGGRTGGKFRAPPEKFLRAGCLKTPLDVRPLCAVESRFHAIWGLVGVGWGCWG